jgi:osmotically-inducible protein OsmY
MSARASRRWLAGVGGLALVALAGCATVDRTEDMRIESEVKARLVATEDANLTRLGVVSSGGVVHLSGTVEAPDQRARAAAVAKDVRGVRRVVNTLDVATSRR